MWWVQWLRGECWEQLSECEVRNNDLLCVPSSICLLWTSTSLTLPKKQKLFDSLGQCWLWDLPCSLLLPRPWLQGNSFFPLPSSSSSFPKQALCSAAPMSCRAYRVGSVESVLLSRPPERFGKPSRKLSVSGMEDEGRRGRNGQRKRRRRKKTCTIAVQGLTFKAL